LARDVGGGARIELHAIEPVTVQIDAGDERTVGAKPDNGREADAGRCSGDENTQASGHGHGRAGYRTSFGERPARAYDAPVGERADIVVIGAGLMGTSIAFQLARRGCGDVLLVERAAVCAGDSGLCFGMVRRHYSNEVVARLAMRGVEVIKRWPEEVGVGDSGYVSTGYLLTATADRLGALEDNISRLRSIGLDTTLVSPAEIAEIEPLMRIDGIAAGAYEPDGGFADTQKMTLSWFAAALGLGLRAAIGRAVTGLRVAAGRVQAVETDSGPIETGTVVLAAGGWGAALARSAGLELQIGLRRVQVAHVRQPAGHSQASVTFSDMASNLVLRPDRAGIALVVAYQPPELLEERDACRNRVDPSYEASIRAALRERMPAYAGATWLDGFAGAYDFTPDWNPLLGWAPGVGGLYLALGWSGHGFKLAPAVGEVVADDVTGRAPRLDITPLSPDRFARGLPLRLAYGPGARA
jgi:sarcosine oxidase subunit beta